MDMKHIETKKNWTINTSNRRFLCTASTLAKWFLAIKREEKHQLVGLFTFDDLSTWDMIEAAVNLFMHKTIQTMQHLWISIFLWPMYTNCFVHFDMVLVHCHLWFPVSRAPTTGLLISCVRQRNCPRCAALLVKWSLLPFGPKFCWRKPNWFCGWKPNWFLLNPVFVDFSLQIPSKSANSPFSGWRNSWFSPKSVIARGQLSNLMKIIKGILERVITHHWALIVGETLRFPITIEQFHTQWHWLIIIGIDLATRHMFICRVTIIHQWTELEIQIDPTTIRGFCNRFPIAGHISRHWIPITFKFIFHERRSPIFV